MERSAAKKTLTIITFFLTTALPASAFFCPPRPQRPPYNIIVGNITKIDEPERSFPVPLNSIRITVEGTNFFTFTDSEGNFYLSDIEQNNIQLLFEYSDGKARLNLGEVGFNNSVVLSDIVIAYGKVDFGKKEIRPFQTLEITGTAQ